jgi:Mrp family chromosome partitioning ATPase
MIRVAICGGDELRSTCAALGLQESSAPRLVLVDLRHPGAAEQAASYAPALPRILIGAAEQAACFAALGATESRLTMSADPRSIGPLIAELIPRPVRERTRVVTLTAARGGVGRTLCTANLARRLTEAGSVLALDATGTGALSWWLGVEARPWSELEVLAAELRVEHVELVATPVAPRLTLVGGAPTAPSLEALIATIVVARTIADLVLVDAPLLADPRAQAAVTRSDRVLVLSYADPASTAALATAELPSSVWLIGSQSPVTGAFRVMPRDERAVGDVLERRGRASGALGRAYDELAELLGIDAS